MIIDTYCLVFTSRLIVRLTKINFLNARLIAIKNFNRTAALVLSRTESYRQPVACPRSDNRITDHLSWNSDTTTILGYSKPLTAFDLTQSVLAAENRQQ